MTKIANIGRTTIAERYSLVATMRQHTGQDITVYPNGDVVCTNRAADIILTGGRRIGTVARLDRHAES